jgi:hypothetical protein
MTVHDTSPPVLEEGQDAAGGEATPPLRPPSAKGTSMRLAMIVPGLGVLILGAFITAGFLTSTKVQPLKSSTSASTVVGSTLQAIPGATALRSITANGEPPANILNAVSLPQGAVAISHQNNGSAAGQYDAQVEFRSDASQGALNGFYQTVMKRQGWQIFNKGPADHLPNGLEVLGKQAGADGFYWEMGAVISPTTFGKDAPPAGQTDFTVRLFQVPDPD